ncbi:hypothetical protein [Gordonia malaquae]|uniref:hypothetical protein n=1 Tax=Gordonia malaquae TaxID=410332 RepID=UPI001CBA6029|nr:hypothetical protein [Gordonia malaquae]
MLAAAGVAVVAIAAVGGYFWYRNWDDKRHTTCDYTAAPVDFAKTIKAVETQLATAPPSRRHRAKRSSKNFETAKPSRGRRLCQTVGPSTLEPST